MAEILTFAELKGRAIQTAAGLGEKRDALVDGSPKAGVWLGNAQELLLALAGRSPKESFWSEHLAEISRETRLPIRRVREDSLRALFSDLEEVSAEVFIKRIDGIVDLSPSLTTATMLNEWRLG